jgi:serine/threonine-protein kinase RsbW
MTNPMQITLGHALSEIALISEGVDRFFDIHGLPDKARMHVTLALDELATNAISYGYPDGAGGEAALTITLKLEGDDLIAILEDEGIAFDPLSTPEPDTTLSLDERKIGGLGVHFVRALMDEMTYERAGNANRLILRKRLHPPN